jgi:hypothetical protein
MILRLYRKITAAATAAATESFGNRNLRFTLHSKQS